MPDVTFDFGGRTVIVTGAGRGIGLALARGFADAGATVVAVEVDEDALGEIASHANVIATVADVSVTEDVERVVAAAVERTGRIDVLINNAGILRDTVLWRLEDEDWDAVLAVHLGGTFRFTRACTPHFRERGYGRVVNFTSYTGLHGNVGQANYATAKAGLIGFTKTAAKELARFGITVNAVSPNAMTRMVESIPPETRKAIEALIPMGRFSTPEEVFPTVAFLASEEAGYVTGTVVPIDGGISM